MTLLRGLLTGSALGCIVPYDIWRFFYLVGPPSLKALTCLHLLYVCTLAFHKAVWFNGLRGARRSHHLRSCILPCTTDSCVITDLIHTLSPVNKRKKTEQKLFDFDSGKRVRVSPAGRITLFFSLAAWKHRGTGFDCILTPIGITIGHDKPASLFDV
jgi:hypothetical protein